jgi:endoglucanase
MKTGSTPEAGYAVAALGVVGGLLAPATACVSPPSAAPSARPNLPQQSSPEPAERASPPPNQPKLLHGMNFGNALDAPHEGDWGVVLDEQDFSRVHAAGFDHVRLPVRFSAHALASSPYTIDDEFFRRVDWAIARALASDLAIIVDMHHYEELMSEPEIHAGRFVGLWRQIAERYRNAPDAVCFELLNEPHDELTADKWNGLLASALEVVRATNPTRTVIVEGAEWASARSLRDSLRVPDDAALVGSFHMYEPMLFTHQGASWMTAEYRTTGIRFPGPPSVPVTPDEAAKAASWARDWIDRYNREPADSNPSSPRTIAGQLDLAKAFADAHRMRVYMGEFGAIDQADMASRATWIRTTRQEAENRGFGWAYWDDGGGFKAYDRQRGAWVPELLAALRR